MSTQIRCINLTYGLTFAAGFRLVQTRWIRSISAVRSSVSSNKLQRLLRECVRVLKPGGGIRLVVPNLTNAVIAYGQKQHSWFPDDFPRHFDSLGGRFSNFVFCDGQHRTAFDFSYMEEMLRGAGFRQVEEVAEGCSRLYGDKTPPYEPGDSRDCRIPCTLRRSCRFSPSAKV